MIGPGFSFGDPQAFDFDHDGHFDHVFIESRVKPAPGAEGVRRWNDIDEFGEEFNNGAEKASYGQPVIFDTDNGDPFAYLHKSLPGTIDGGNLSDVFQEAFADQTSALGLLTFTAEGDLPITWSLKASLAKVSSARDVTITQDYLDNWNKQWQDYYFCNGQRPLLPLAPGTNPPARDGTYHCPGASAPASGGTTSTTTTTITTIIQQVAGGANNARSATGSSAKNASKASIRSARVVATRSGKRVVVFVKSASKTARIQIRMYNAKGRRVGQVTKTVRTNRSVQVSGVRVAGKVKTVKVTLVG